MLITAQMRGESLSPLQNSGIPSILRPRTRVVIRNHVVSFDVVTDRRNR